MIQLRELTSLDPRLRFKKNFGGSFRVLLCRLFRIKQGMLSFVLLCYASSSFVFLLDITIDFIGRWSGKKTKQKTQVIINKLQIGAVASKKQT